MKETKKQQLIGLIKSAVKRLLPHSVIERITQARYVKEVRGHNVPEFTVIRSLIDPGDVVLDIGANFGWYTRFMSEVVGKDGIVYSIEPVPLNFKVLVGIMRALNISNVRCFQYAVSETDGTQTMAVPLTGAGDENLYEAKIVADKSGPHTHVIEVTTRSLDSLFAGEQPSIEFIKCDVEGHELNCLRGARTLIKRSHPAWMIEIWGDPDDPSSDASATFRLFAEEGYVPYIFDGKRLSRRKPGEQENDYFFLQPTQVERLNRHGLMNDAVS